MRVRDEDAVDRTVRLSQNPLDMLRIRRSRIDDEMAVLANEVRVRTRPRHETRIVRDQSAHTGRDCVELTGSQRIRIHVDVR